MQLSKDIAAVVTGGASGLGAATARALAAKGVKVALLDLNSGLGEPLAKELGGVFVQGDVTNEASVDAALAAARKAHGQERILVNCAGIGIAKRITSRNKETGTFDPHDLASFAKVIQINLIGTFLMMSGLFLTPMFDNLSEEARRSLAASVPFPARLGSPTEYAALAVHICENPMLNGECIRLDGALRMAPR